MSSFFNVSALGGNPFSTPVGLRIENATDASLDAENWALNMEICDLINESADTARDAMRAIRKRLAQNAGKNYTVIMYTLTVLETCVKNCGKPLHVLVAQKDFVQELVKLIGPKNDPPAAVQEKVLQLIQLWAEAFRAQPDLTGVVQVYSELKNKGIEFPVADPETLAPIYTPQRSVPESQATAAIPLPISPQHDAAGGVISVSPSTAAAAAVATAQSQSHSGLGLAAPALVAPQSASPEQIAKLQSELDIVTMNMAVLGEMLTELRPGQEQPDDYRLLTELTQTCHEMQARIVELIGRINHDEITAELLRLNDELNNLFLRHQRYEKNRDPQSVGSAAAGAGGATAGPAAMLGAAMGVPAASAALSAAGDRSSNSLIDFNDELATGSGNSLSDQLTGLGLGPSGKQPNARGDVDEFDMLAQSRNNSVGGAAPIATASAQLAALSADVNAISSLSAVPVVLAATSANSTPKKEPLNPSDSDFDEMAAWLDNKGNEKDGPEESLTSMEFDRFLAERAAAADTLPTITSQAGATGATAASAAAAAPSPRAKAKKKEEESLMAL